MQGIINDFSKKGAEAQRHRGSMAQRCDKKERRGAAAQRHGGSGRGARIIWEFEISIIFTVVLKFNY